MLLSRTSLLVTACLGATLLLACSSADKGAKDTQEPVPDLADDADTLKEVETCKSFKLVGQPCNDDCECLGSMCVLTEYAPFRFCTKSCGTAEPGSSCQPDEGLDKFNSVCVQFPSDFLAMPSKFCAPLCSTELDCAKLGAPWENCEKVQWKGNPLYPALPDKVCISPSAQGHDPIDPDTCENWEKIYTVWSTERLTCTEYCDFLFSCKHVAMGGTLTKPCCAYQCMQSMVVDGLVDKEFFKYLRCYVDQYQAFSNSGLVCTKPVDTCGSDPLIP